MTRSWFVRAGWPLVWAAVGLGAASCSTERSASEAAVPPPPRDRPVVQLAFTMADDLASATGTERVAFTPNQEICEVVFRAWPNKPATARPGNRLTVRSITVDGVSLPVRVTPAGAGRGAPGTLVSAPLTSCQAAGTKVTADVSFDVQLGQRTDERLGYVSRGGSIAWLGSAYPLLAWTRAEGWVRDDAVDIVGETATSEVFELESLEVEAPAAYAVAGMGRAEEPRPAATDGRKVHRFSADAVRDVTFTVGEINLRTTTVDQLTVVIATPSAGARASEAVWEEAVRRALGDLSKLLGPVPAEHVWVSILPVVSEGVEFGSAVQLGDVDPGKDRWLVVHELAHLWFYGLVGNNQARDPWLDEAFATYAQEVVAPAGTTKDRAHVVTGAVGEPMLHWATARRGDSAYVDTVYGEGGKALLEAREAAGTAAFDAALREYVRHKEWQIATPSDVRSALDNLPAAIDVLRKAGALR